MQSFCAPVQPVSIASSTYFICLVMPWWVWLQLWWEGIWQLQGFEGWGGEHPRPCQFHFLCLCLDAAAGRRLEELPDWMKHVRPLYSAVRKDRAKTSKIKLRWRLTTFVVFSFVPKYKTLECDNFISKQVASLWQQQPNSKWEFLFHAPDKGLVIFSC